MKFAYIISAVVASVSATSQTGIQMLQALQSLEKNNEINEEGAIYFQNVKELIIKCAADGDCSDEAAKMPNLYRMS